jgi:fucose permease
MRKIYTTICIFISFATYSSSMTVIGPVIDEIEKNLGASTDLVGLLVSSMSVGFIIAVLFSGRFADRYSLKNIMILGQVAHLIGTASFPFCSSLEQGLMAYFSIGIGAGMMQVAANTSISLLYTKNRASSLNALHLFFGVGALSGPPLSGSLMKGGFSWGTPYLVIAISMSVMVALTLFSRFPQVERSEETRTGSLWDLLKSKYILLLCLVAFLIIGIEAGINNWSVLYMEKVMGMEKIIASTILSSFWFLMTLGRIICIYLTRKMRDDTLLLLLAAGTLITYGFYLFTNATVPAAISLALVGLFFSGMFPIVIGLGGYAFPHMPGRVTGIIMTCLGLGMMTVPWLTGVIIEHHGHPLGMRSLAILTALMVAATALVRLYKKK